MAVYKLLQKEPGIPKLYWGGLEGEYNVMVLELLGPSIEDLFHCCKMKLSLPTVLSLACEMVSWR